MCIQEGFHYSAQARRELRRRARLAAKELRARAKKNRHLRTVLKQLQVG